MKPYKLVTLICILIFILPSITSKIIEVTISPRTDTLFERIYIVDTEADRLYLCISCKEKNLISVSVTKELEFEEYPRFPISSPNSNTPKMQRKSYAFFDTCKIEATVEEDGNVLSLKRENTDEVIFTINNFEFIGEDIEIETEDESTKWGMGERFQSNFAIQDGSWTIWNRDRPWEIDGGLFGRSAQTYGHQPVYLARETKTKKFHLIYFKNTYGLNLISTENTKYLKYIVTGGHIHFLVMIGENPESILKRYHAFIGAAAVPPFWSLGYQQSRWGYREFENFVHVVDEFEKLELPLDVMWSDLDYMNNKAVFTVDDWNYPPSKMRDLIEKRGIHYVPLIDVGISIADENATAMGKEMNVFFKSFYEPKLDYVGTVWPGKVNFVDFLHPNGSKYWEQQLDRLYEQIPFSGIWLDMNEPSNFEGNEHIIEGYRIQYQESLNMMTIDSNLNHYCSSSQILKHKEVHAYYGHLTTIPTYDFLKKKNIRPFIITRSNSVGTGAYAGHWTGDNVANWDFLRLSISGNFLFQIFGIQMVGADICGFHKNTNEELCSRWMQVGSFYPFARNHNENESIPQEPYQFGEILLETTKVSFYQRYSLLKQMYSTLLKINGTGSFYRPLFFEFPHDENCYEEKFVETEFLIGNYLLGAPVVEEGKDEREVYFPSGLNNESWIQLETDLKIGVTVTKLIRFQGGSTSIIPNSIPSPPPTFLRGGKLIFVTAPAIRSSELSGNFRIIAGLNDNVAVGSICGINNYSNNTEIDDCQERGCEIKVRILKNEFGFVLEWKFNGRANENYEIMINEIRIVDEESIHVCDEVLIMSGMEGKEKISL